MSPDSMTPATTGPGHRRRRVLLVGLVVVVVLALAGAGAAWAYGRSLNGGVKRTDVFSGMPTDRPVQKVTGAMNILVVGSDSRNPDHTSGSRTDTIMMLHVDAAHQHAYVISIPRDSWVHVPPSPDGQNGDTMSKINAAYAWGGMPLVVQTVESFTGVRVDHAVAIDFAGFQQVVDALGGVEMTVDQTIRSIHPPYRVFTKGQQKFDGAQALDYVRQREQFPDGDFTRERHQQEFLKALLDKAASSGTLSNPVKLNNFLQAVTKAITVDKTFDLVSTAVTLRDLRSANITYLSSPSAGTATIDGQSVVQPDAARAKSLYQAVATDSVAQWLAGPGAPTAAPTGSATTG